MKIVFIEPTPSPNSMKLHLDESLEPGIRKTYTLENERSAPVWIRKMLHISGVKSIFHTADFIALDRKSSSDWAAILSEVQEQFGQDHVESIWDSENFEISGYGEAQVFVQFFRGIPMQIRVKARTHEERISLSQRFVSAVTEVASATLIKERKLVDYGVRYGELPDIAREVEQELEAAFPHDRLQDIIKQAIAHGKSEVEFIEQRRKLSLDEVREYFSAEDWHERYAGLEALQQIDEYALPLLADALKDRQMQIRRLAIVYLGDLRTPEAMELLYNALRDSSAAVRRTAGDTLSDIGDPAATGPMIAALQDSSKLVRWRAARFLYEAGTDDALDPLRIASDDPEFEVSLQARMAVERIESGEAAAGTVWQQMAKRDRTPTSE
ncbi:PBS lyase HEAT-like repeat-containing protein [Fontibacillus panacisegetis]|uniref:PBS lyase HEAT-like repeat-containing protein n=1 Tax=Fontibacillus panacisegetis TaxID=670482 RepID=A0A1G7H652_9BACL|nr:conserved virulence factor C family protein [Fontibacillus panacisegetis]SDE95912.1 PBS lyase HEAT-like repeat-containing protein [Fontibacillus panacisegetis]